MPGPDASNAVALASAYLGARRAPEALRTISLHLASHPDDARALVIASQACLESGDLKRALDFSKAAITLEPDDDMAWRVRSKVLSRMRRFDDARRAAATAQRLAPSFWAAHIARAEVDHAEGTVSAEGWQAIREAVRLAPDEPDVHLVLGNLARVSRDNDTAEAAYRTALRIEPGHLSARHNLALVMLTTGRAGEAAEGFLDVLSKDPAHVLASRHIRTTARLTVAQIFPVFAVAVTLLLILTGSSLFYTRWPTPVLVVTRVLVSAAAALCGFTVTSYVLRLRTSAGGRFWMFVRTMPRIDPYSTAFALLFVLVFGLMLAACVTEFDVSFALYGCCWVVLVAIIVVSSVHETEEGRRAALKG